MSRPVILFRSFNAFLGQIVSVWSIGLLIGPGILSFIIAGFFAWPIVVPLAVVCGIVGAVALVWGGLTGYWRYQYLTKEANKFLNRIDFKVQEKLDYLEAKDGQPPELDIPFNTVILIEKDKQQAEAYFKRCVAGKGVDININIDLTLEEKEIVFPTEREKTNLIAEESEEDTHSTSSEEESVKEMKGYGYDLPLIVVKDKLPDEKTLRAPVLIKMENNTGETSFHIFGISKRKTQFTTLDIIDPLKKLNFNIEKQSIFVSPEENKEIYQEIASKKGHTPRDPVINKIIDRVLSAGNFFNRPRLLNEANKLTQDQENILTWERINAFLSDAPTALIFSSIIIFLITHVFFGALIPAALLIAVIVSIAYGSLSAFVKDAQMNSKLLTTKMLRDEYEAIKTKTNTFIVEANVYIKKANDLITGANQLGQQELVSNLEKAKEAITQQKTELESLQKSFTEVDNAQPEFTNKEKFRVIYSLVYGGIVAGSFLYIALPLVIGALGLAPFSLPVLLGIVIGAACIYGAYHAWHKVKVIQEEKWATMNDQTIQEISSSFAEVNKVLTENIQQIEAKEKEFAAIEGNNSQLPDNPVSFNNALQEGIQLIQELEEEVIKKKNEVINKLDFFSKEPIELKDFSNYSENSQDTSEDESTSLLTNSDQSTSLLTTS